jgi:hypothetical protein
MNLLIPQPSLHRHYAALQHFRPVVLFRPTDMQKSFLVHEPTKQIHAKQPNAGPIRHETKRGQRQMMSGQNSAPRVQHLLNGPAVHSEDSLAVVT